MTSTIHFSFIMVTNNRSSCICTAIDSFLVQNCSNCELIIVDNGSTDDTKNCIYVNYAEDIATGRIKFVTIEKSGIAKARNKGLLEAQYDWIAYLDADSVLRPSFIESFAKAIKLHSYRIFYAKAQYQCSHKVIGESFSYQELWFSNYIDLGVFVHHKTVFADLGGFDESLENLVDWDLILTYTRNYTPIFIDEVLLEYHGIKKYTKTMQSNVSACEAVRKKHKAYFSEERPKFRLFKKVKRLNGRRDIYFCGMKIFSYEGRKSYTAPCINLSEYDKKIRSFTGIGIAEQEASSKIIVSLTSFPQRMHDIHYTLYSLLNQSYKPDMVILWLGEEQFPNGEEDIPSKVLKLRENGLTIKWCRDIKSYKKLIPALQELPQHTIITADDDIFYHADWLQQLIEAYNAEPQYIHCHRAHKILFADDSTLLPYRQWKFNHTSSEPSFLHFATGAGGILYPPQSLDSDVLHEEIFKKLAPHADDIWFWAMALKKGTKIKIVANPQHLVYVNPERESPKNGDKSLVVYNVLNGGNDAQLAKVLEHYNLLPYIQHKD